MRDITPLPETFLKVRLIEHPELGPLTIGFKYFGNEPRVVLHGMGGPLLSHRMDNEMSVREFNFKLHSYGFVEEVAWSESDGVLLVPAAKRPKLKYRTKPVPTGSLIKPVKGKRATQEVVGFDGKMVLLKVLDPEAAVRQRGQITECPLTIFDLIWVVCE
tara:strand:- start:880 stop:1359 length:480 start_codon:yes stop_codon:yes gene_type:complete